MRRRFEELAGATGLEPAASCVTGRRSNQLNYAPALHLYLFPAVPSDGSAFPSLPFGRAVTGQRSADNRKSDFLVNELRKHGLFLRRSRRETHLHRVKLPKGLAQAPGINFSRYIIIY